MANLRSAEKAQRQSVRRRVFNIRRSRAMKEAVKHFLTLVQEGKKNEAQKAWPQMQKAIDKATQRGVIKKQTASRKKSRLLAKVEAIK